MTTKDADSKLELAADPVAGTPIDRASESVVSQGPSALAASRAGSYAPEPRQTSAISSGPFEIAASAPVSTSTLPAVGPPPSPAEMIHHAMGRSKRMPIERIVAIGAGIVVVAIVLSVVLLFC